VQRVAALDRRLRWVRRRLWAGWLAALTVMALRSPAQAQQTASASRATAARERDRPYTMVELPASVISLPLADVCLTKEASSCGKGEVSLAMGLRHFYRRGPFAFGAGLAFARTLRGDPPPGVDDPTLERSHSRGYLLVEGLFRYTLLRTKDIETWAGPTVGGVVVKDSWSVKADRQPYSDTAFVGPRSVTIGTEGIVLGLGAGADWIFAHNWSVGSQIRYGSWFLPSDPVKNPTGDTASLSGRTDVLELGFTVAYRIAL